MRDRLVRRVAAAAGVLLALTVVANDLILDPPELVDRAATALVEVIEGGP